MKHVIILVMALTTLNAAYSQKTPVTASAADMSMSFVQSNGTNGSAVAYNPNLKLYYIAIAGNVEYPLEVKDAQGKALYELSTGVDLRGLWYNSSKNRLEGNQYGGGLFALPLDQRGYPTSEVITITENTFPEYDQACAVFDGKNLLYYYTDGILYRYSAKNNKPKGEVTLALPVDRYSINGTSVIYTGYKGYEIGLLDADLSKVYLFNKKTGTLTATIDLTDWPVLEYSFWFAFANDRVWLYDSETRTWSGYRIF